MMVVLLLLGYIGMVVSGFWLVQLGWVGVYSLSILEGLQLLLFSLLRFALEHVLFLLSGPLHLVQEFAFFLVFPGVFLLYGFMGLPG